MCKFFCFFFSSRRRHTRFSRDWSSDVCSSDLKTDWLFHPDRHAAGSEDQSRAGFLAFVRQEDKRHTFGISHGELALTAADGERCLSSSVVAGKIAEVFQIIDFAGATKTRNPNIHEAETRDGEGILLPLIGKNSLT